MDIDKKVMRYFNYRLALKWLMVFAIFIFLGKMVWDNWDQVKETPFTLRSFPFILSTLIFALSYFIQIWAWYLITLRLKIALPPSETLKSWFYSQLGKYLPGRIWVFLGRFYLYESKGKSKKTVSVALYFEMVTIIAAACLIFLAGLILYKEIWLFTSWKQSVWPTLLLLLGLASLHPQVLQKILNWTLVRFKREPVSLSISYSDILWILFVGVASWVVGGVGFYLFVDSVYPVAPQYALFLTGSLAVSSTLGLVAIFTPSGLGVREGALVYLLSFIMATPVSVVISILTRIWITFIEMGLIGMVYLFSQFRKGSGKGNQRANAKKETETGQRRKGSLNTPA
jgi:uncharacterized membrane protein YbhN (UPF0104 family)